MAINKCTGFNDELSGGIFALNLKWRTLRDSNPRPIGSKPTTLSS